MAITYLGSDGGAYLVGTSIPCYSVPGETWGDYKLVAIWSIGGAAVTGTPAGFALLGSCTDASGRTLSIYGRAAPATGTFSTGASGALEEIARGYRGADAGSPVADVQAHANASGTTHTSADATAPNDAMVILFMARPGSAVDTTPSTPAGMGNHAFPSAAALSLGVVECWDMTQAVAGATGAKTMTTPNATETCTVTVVLAPAAPAAPTAPSGLTATADGSTAIDLAWVDESSDETGFEIQRSPDNATWALVQTTAAGATSWHDGGRAAGTQYYYRVRAVNAAGNSAYTASADATTDAAPSVPDAPAGLTATAISSSRIDLAWSDVAGESGYKVERSPNGSTLWAEIGGTGIGALAFSDTGLAAATQYFYRVRAWNAGGNGDYSSTDDATTEASGGVPSFHFVFRVTGKVA